MSSSSEYLYAEILCDNRLMEAFANEKSAYYQGERDSKRRVINKKLIARLNWHINHSLSERQRQVLSLLKTDKTEREIAAILGITQQVVHIYKWRAIRKLRKKI